MALKRWIELLNIAGVLDADVDDSKAQLNVWINVLNLAQTLGKNAKIHLTKIEGLLKAIR